MDNNAIQFRYLQRVDGEGAPLGLPVLQLRRRFDIDADGAFRAHWEFGEWEDVPCVAE